MIFASLSPLVLCTIHIKWWNVVMSFGKTTNVVVPNANFPPEIEKQDTGLGARVGPGRAGPENVERNNNSDMGDTNVSLTLLLLLPKPLQLSLLMSLYLLLQSRAQHVYIAFPSLSPLSSFQSHSIHDAEQSSVASVVSPL